MRSLHYALQCVVCLACEPVVLASPRRGYIKHENLDEILTNRLQLAVQKDAIIGAGQLGQLKLR